MKNILNVARLLLPHSGFDALGVGVIDFSRSTFEVFEATNFYDEFQIKAEPVLYFDLASLTKPLTNSLTYFLRPEAFDEQTLLCLNHRGGLPSWGLLPKEGWQAQILEYPIKPSPTVYSDFSALRVMLEYEKRNPGMKALCQNVWDKETMFWKDLPSWFPTLQCGYKNGLPNYGQVHDPNAWTIDSFCSHAGLFSTADGLCRTLLNYNSKTDFIQKVKTDLQSHNHRFSYGWDRVENPQLTLAGTGCGKLTFGHLGFTGTSIWIDPEKMRGHIILSNAVKEFWYKKQELNEIRKAIGELVWRM